MVATRTEKTDPAWVMGHTGKENFYNDKRRVDQKDDDDDDDDNGDDDDDDDDDGDDDYESESSNLSLYSISWLWATRGRVGGRRVAFLSFAEALEMLFDKQVIILIILNIIKIIKNIIIIIIIVIMIIIIIMIILGTVLPELAHS